MASTRQKEFTQPLQVVVTPEVRLRIQNVAILRNVSMAEVIRILITTTMSLTKLERDSEKQFDKAQEVKDAPQDEGPKPRGGRPRRAR